MDYLRWLVAKVFLDNTNKQVFFPLFGISVMLVGFGFYIHLILGIVLATLAAIFWGMIIYVVLLEFYKDTHKDYLRDKARNGGMK